MSINNNSVINYLDSELNYPLAYSAPDNGKDVIESALVNKTISDVHTNSSLVQTYVAGCLTQKNIELDKIISIKQTQQEAREHARHWLDTLVPRINRIYTDVTGFCNLSDAYWDDLLSKANEIRHKNDEHAQDFKEIIQELKTDIHTRTTSTALLTSDLATFRSYLEEDNRNFQTVISDADRIYAGSDGELEITKQNITAIKTAIDKDIGIIAGGAVAIVGGIIVIAVAVIGSVVTGGAAIKLLAVGVVTTLAGIGMVAAASADLVKQQENYGRALEKLKQLEHEMAALKNVEDHFTGLRSNNENANKAVESMRLAWVVINNNFQELEQSVENIDPDKKILLVGRVKATQKNFNSLRTQAENMQKNSILNVDIAPELAASLRLTKTFYSFRAYSLSTKRCINPTPWRLTLPELAELIG